jgi:hypothetical protein
VLAYHRVQEDFRRRSAACSPVKPKAGHTASFGNWSNSGEGSGLRMGGAKQNQWRIAAAYIAAFTLLLQALLFPVCNTPGGAFKGELSGSADAPWAASSDSFSLCIAGSPEHGGDGSPSQNSGGGHHRILACCGSCCPAALPAAFAALSSAPLDYQISIGYDGRAIPFAGKTIARNRSPPVLLSI